MKAGNVVAQLTHAVAASEQFQHVTCNAMPARGEEVLPLAKVGGNERTEVHERLLIGSLQGIRVDGLRARGSCQECECEEEGEQECRLQRERRGDQSHMMENREQRGAHVASRITTGQHSSATDLTLVH